jgi:hypothetical protein
MGLSNSSLLFIYFSVGHFLYYDLIFPREFIANILYVLLRDIP